MTRSDLIKTIAGKVDGVTQEKAKEIVAVTRFNCRCTYRWR